MTPFGIPKESYSIVPPADKSGNQWIELLPVGKLTGRDGRNFIVSNVQDVISNSFEQSSGGKIPVDYNHAIDLAAPRGGDAPAAGWISKMEVRDGGIWGLVRWTDKAKNSISEGEYRHISPALKLDRSGSVHSILRASLVNTPNLNVASLHSQNWNIDMDESEFITQLRTALSLPEDADYQLILSAISELTTNLNSTDLTKFVPIEEFKKANELIISLQSKGANPERAEALVDNAILGMRLAPALKDWAVSLCMHDESAFNVFLGNGGAEFAEMTDGFTKSLNTRSIDFSGFHKRDLEGSKHSKPSFIAEQMGLSEDDFKRYGGKD